MKRNIGIAWLIIVGFVIFTACTKDKKLRSVEFRQEMRQFVMEISNYSNTYNNNFIVIPQNGQALITSNGEGNGIPMYDYLQAIHATGREDLFYGYNADNQATPQQENERMLSLCEICEQNNVEVLAVDYCSSYENMDNSYIQNENHGFISFAANDRNLKNIPDYPTEPFNVNNNDILSISQAKNFLYLINPENYTTKQSFINALKQTNYDLIIMDLFYSEETYTPNEIEQLKTKQNGGKRLVVCYMSIGEAENYRYYWKNNWNNHKPDWLEEENSSWSGNYKVRYWYPEWKRIIYGNENSYLKLIVNAGFDGVYLDIIDAFEYFEEKYH